MQRTRRLRDVPSSGSAELAKRWQRVHLVGAGRPLPDSEFRNCDLAQQTSRRKQSTPPAASICRRESSS